MVVMEEEDMTETAVITGMEEMADMIGMAIMTMSKGVNNDVRKIITIIPTR